MTRKGVSKLIFFLIAASFGLPSLASGDEFGTGVTFLAPNQLPFLGNGGPLLINVGQGATISSNTINTATGTTNQNGAAFAGVNGFSVGIEQDSTDPKAGGATLVADAVSTFLVSGAGPGILVPATITVDGSFIGNPAVDSLFNFVFIGDLSRNFFEELDVNTRLVNGVGEFIYDATPSVGCGLCPTAEGVWSGSLTLNFLIPVNAGANSVVAEMYGQAAPAISGGSFSVSMNFFNTATLTFNPPPGVQVTLADGQVFGGPSPTVPEPSSILLLATGLGGIVTLIRRRFC